MNPEEIIRYKFFLGTACREKEVTYAAWQDVDFARGIYHIRRKPDVGFTPKKHESRDVKMPTELVELLRERKKHAPHSRWIFVNNDGRPDNHFLRKLKRLANWPTVLIPGVSDATVRQQLGRLPCLPSPPLKATVPMISHFANYGRKLASKPAVAIASRFFIGFARRMVPVAPSVSQIRIPFFVIRLPCGCRPSRSQIRIALS
jgi:hypothetical protein